MKTITNLIAASLLAVATIVPATVAESAPISAPRPAVEGQSDITNAYWRRVCNYRRCRRVWVEPRYVRPRYVRPRAAVRGGHVRWCLNRYRSYNPATDSYRGYDGRYHRCHSPFR